MLEGYDQLENHDHVSFKRIYDFKIEINHSKFVGHNKIFH
jgi:hypothetical protein